MTFLPIVARELRVTARRRQTYWTRVGTAAAFVAVAAFLLPALASQFSVAQGKVLFSVLGTLAFVYCLLAGARVTSDCISVEKREGTIGLLFLTDLKGYDVVLGKLVSCSLAACYGLLATVPVLSLALLLGGVTLGEIGRIALLFLNTLFFSMAAGVFVSSLSRNDRRALFATVLVIMLVAGGPFLAGYGFVLWRSHPGQGLSSFEEASFLFTPSPIFAFQLAHDTNRSAFLTTEFYSSVLMTHVLGWILLAISSLAVPRVCRERPPGQRKLRWLEFRNRWSFGKPAQRLAFRARLLDRNAFYWLAARDRIKAQYVWFLVISMGLIWSWAGWVMQSFIFDWDVSFWLLLMLFLFLKIWLASEVCARLVEDRAIGAFELLLSSPLDVADMAKGQSLALRRQFGRPVLLLLLLTYLLMVSALRSPHSGLTSGEVEVLFWSLMLMLVADLITLKWVGMWHAVNTSQINRAMTAACGRVLLLPTLLFGVAWIIVTLLEQGLGLASANEETGHWGRAGALWLGIGLANDLFFGLRARWLFLRHFREVATQRYVQTPVGLKPFLELWRGLLGWFRAHAPAHGTSPERPFRRWPWAVAMATPLVAALLAFAGWRFSLSRQVEAQLRALRTAGEPTSITALQAWLPAVPEQENAGAALAKIAPLLAAQARFHPQKLEWPGPHGTLSPDQRAEMAGLINLNQRALPLLHAAAALPVSRYPLDWRVTPARMAGWQMHQLRQAEPILQFDALLRAEAGDRSGAFQDLLTLVGIARILQQEPLLSAQGQRLQFLRAALAILEWMLNQQGLTLEQLQSLANQLRLADESTGVALSRAFIGERCLLIHELQVQRRQAAPWAPGASSIQQLSAALVESTGNLFGVPDRLLMDGLDLLGRFIDGARQIGGTNSGIDWTNPRFPQADRLSAAARHSAREDYLHNVLRDQIELVARLRVARTALAIEGFRAGHQGRPPSHLGQLVPDFLAAVPSDPFTQSALPYKLLPKGYVVYSVGKDGHDNGGLSPNGIGGARPPAEFDLPFTVSW